MFIFSSMQRWQFGACFWPGKKRICGGRHTLLCHLAWPQKRPDPDHDKLNRYRLV